MTDTINYSGHGYIYQCPECKKADRSPYFVSATPCRHCNHYIELNEVQKMTPLLYEVVQELNRLETGTIFGMSEEMLRESNIGRQAKSVGVDIVKALTSKKVIAKHNNGWVDVHLEGNPHVSGSGKDLASALAIMVISNQHIFFKICWE